MNPLLTGIVATWVAAHAAWADPVALTLRQLQDRAVQDSPDLKGLGQKLSAARAAARQAGRWGNPEFEATLDGDEQDFSLRQPVDLWGKRGLARQVGEAEAAASAANLENARQDLRFEVAQPFWALASATEAQALLDQELNAWDRLLAIRQGELKAGDISAQDLLAQQALWAQRRQARWQLAAQAASARSALNALVGQPPGAPLTVAPADEPAPDVRDAQAGLEAAERRVAQQAFSAYELWRQAGDAFQQQRALIDATVGPQQTLTERAYRAGGVSEQDLLAVRIGALQRRAELATLRGQRGLARARLERLIARPH